MAFFRTEKAQTAGIALGGIGSGSVELQPDGEFHYWQIANQSRWGGQCDQWEMDDGESHAGALFFYVRCKTDGKTVVRKLGMKTDPDDFTYRMFAWNKPVRAIEYDGCFPVCDLKYIDEALPVELKLSAAAPFVPGDTDLSATPGFVLDFDVTALEDSEIGLMGSLEPSFANSGRCSNTLINKNEMCAVKIDPASGNDDPQTGNMTFSVSGDGERSYITADYFRFLREFVSHSEFGITQESFLFGFRERGRLPDTDVGEAPEEIPRDLSALPDESITELAGKLSRYPMALSFLSRIRRLRPGFPEDRADNESLIRYMARQIRDIGGDFGSTALCSSISLKKGEKARVRFCLSWYFPNHFSRYGERMGHYYENLYADSYEANLVLVTNGRIVESARKFASLLRKGSAPGYDPDTLSTHLSTLIKDSWYLKNGKFALWEGLGSCGFHTTDITYHASFGLISLFPRLQLGQMKMGAKFQRSDGRVHHFLTPDLEHDDGGFDRVDMNPQFVLMVCRDYLFTGDSEYLRGLWGNVISAMDSTALLDRNGDGLPDTGTGSNTYDAWRFSGTPAYISILWLASLKAAAYLARVMRDPEREGKWGATLEKGKASLEKLLWNGKYYDLWNNGEERDGALMTDQLDGEWFLRMAGLGGNLTDDRVREVLSFIFDNNFDAEDGLVNASCPDGAPVSVYTYKNCQAEAVWTGIGYAFSALCISAGLPDRAKRITGLIHDNQKRFGAFWSHWECGAYYTRPMSSWSVLIALTGMRINAAERSLSLEPVASGVLPLCIPGALGSLTVIDEECIIDLYEGTLDGWKLEAGGRRVTVTRAPR